MFQYAIGYSLSRRLQDELDMSIDWYSQFNFPHLQLEINKFPLVFPEYPDQGIDTIMINGYFQKPIIFNDYKEELKEIFQADHTTLIGDTIAMHVRRGDYIDLGRTLELEYYKKAIESYSSGNIIIFTDDVEYCETNFDYPIHETKNPIYDMLTMSTASKFIIANSTFSWWAAYLSGSKEVIYPSSILTTNNLNICTGLGWQEI